MGNEELMALLQNLQGSGAGRQLGNGLLSQLPSLLDGLSAATGSSTTSSTGTRSSSSSSVSTAAKSLGSSLGSTALNTVGGGLTLLPIVSGLLKLFGVGGKKEEPPPLEKFALPPSIQAEAGLSASGDTFLIDRGVGDQIRPLQTPAARTPSPVTSGASGPGSSGNGAPITVNVQAMDSQSFLDRREDIARAVREAMLQSHSLNDVVSEL